MRTTLLLIGVILLVPFVAAPTAVATPECGEGCGIDPGPYCVNEPCGEPICLPRPHVCAPDRL